MPTDYSRIFKSPNFQFVISKIVVSSFFKIIVSLFVIVAAGRETAKCDDKPAKINQTENAVRKGKRTNPGKGNLLTPTVSVSSPPHSPPR